MALENCWNETVIRMRRNCHCLQEAEIRKEEPNTKCSVGDLEMPKLVKDLRIVKGYETSLWFFFLFIV